MQNKTPSMPPVPQGPEVPPNNQSNWNENAKNYIVYSIIALVGVILLFTFVWPQQSNTEEISLSKAVSDIGEGKVSTAKVDGNRVELTYSDSDTVRITNKEPGDTFASQLETYGVDPNKVKIDPQGESTTDLWLNILGTFLPILLIAGFFFII